MVGDGLIQAMGEGRPSNPLLRDTQSCLDTHLQVGKPRPREATRSLRLNPGVCLVQGCSHYLWVQGTNGEGEAETLGSGTKVFYCPRKGGHTFGSEPMAPFIETGAGLKVTVTGFR